MLVTSIFSFSHNVFDPIKYRNLYLTLYHTILTFNESEKGDLKTFWKKEKVLVTSIYFLLFPQCFLPYQRQKSSYELHLFCHLQMLSIWSHPKLSFGKELINICRLQMPRVCTRLKNYPSSKSLVLRFCSCFSLTTRSRHLTTLKKKALENTVGKGENAGNQHFLLSP